MLKIIVFNMVSVDGYYARINGEIDWHKVDAEFNEFAISQLKEVDTLLFGRVTYDLMAGYWPKEDVIKDDPLVAKAMNESKKIVFSKTLKTADWNNTQLMADINTNEIKKLKDIAEKDIFIFGSGQLVHEFEKLGLIDEYRLIINPLTLGQGKPMFVDEMDFQLLKSREFKNGNVMLYYKKINQESVSK